MSRKRYRISKRYSLEAEFVDMSGGLHRIDMYWYPNTPDKMTSKELKRYHEVREEIIVGFLGKKPAAIPPEGFKVH